MCLPLGPGGLHDRLDNRTPRESRGARPVRYEIGSFQLNLPEHLLLEPEAATQEV